MLLPEGLGAAVGRVRDWPYLRAVVAIVAAYALALQMLLTGVLVTQAAAATPDSPFVICYGADGSAVDHGSGTPAAAHASCAACIIASFAPPAAPVPDVSVVRFAEYVAFAALDTAPRTTQPRHEPRTSQGPPRNA